MFLKVPERRAVGTGHRPVPDVALMEQEQQTASTVVAQLGSMVAPEPALADPVVGQAVADAPLPSSEYGGFVANRR